MRFHRIALPLAFGLAAGCSALTAQTSATAAVAASALVSGGRTVPVLAALGVTNLAFGTVTAGGPHSTTSIATDAGRFNITGADNTPVTVAFLLPTVLTSVHGNTIPISFNATDGIQWVAYPTTAVRFDPNVPHLATLSNLGHLTVGIAGTIAPPAGTITGAYTGVITLTVSY